MKKQRKQVIAWCMLFILCLLPVFSAGIPVRAEETEKKNTKITIKPASDFTLKIPAGWKDNYVVKGTKKKKRDSYLGFYSKKCYKQTKQGWLFSIARYKDDSYKDNMPAYELVGEWDGFYYVAIFPTDVQTEGSTKKAKKQYNKLNKSVEKVVKSIRKVEK